MCKNGKLVAGLIGGVLPVAIYFAVRRLPLPDAATIFFSGEKIRPQEEKKNTPS
jgi:hypothetical protein